MKKHFIVSIGTSVINNYNKKVAEEEAIKPQYPSFIKTRNTPFYIPFTKEQFPMPEWFYEGFESKIAPMLQKKGYIGAEQETLDNEQLLNLRTPESVFHLIATDTRESLFCASYLGHVYLKNWTVFFYIPPGLEYADNDHFKNTGIPNLLACVAKILNDVEKEEEEAIIVPTGGFKILAPYMTIASILYKWPAYYIYEKTRKTIELPAPPMSVDMVAYRSVLPLLENTVGLNLNRSTPFYRALPESFRMLLYTDASGKFMYTAFGERLKDMYTRQIGSPLTLRASRNSLIPRLGPYQDRFLEITRLGETVWLGDKAPEMADHARRHHLNLFAYAELLLLPIFMDDPDFLSEVELFLLLATIYLHDCGHSLSALPAEEGNIPLLPTEIRNYHNLLGYCRLRGDDFGRTLARQGLELPKELLDCVALISMYHRKKMPLLKGECRVLESEYVFGPLSEQRITFGGQTIEGDRLALILSLFRIIDGMDKQVDRAGDAVEISMRAEAILADLPYLLARRRRLESVIVQMAPAAKKAADEILLEIVKDYVSKEPMAAAEEREKKSDVPAKAKDSCGGREGCDFEVRSPGDFSETPYYQKLEKNLQNEGAAKSLPLAWEYLDARTRLFFQALQPTYYHSDLLLSMPRVSHTKKEGMRRITISYSKNPDPGNAAATLESVREAIVQWIKDHLSDEDPEWRASLADLADAEAVVCGIRDEYCSRKLSEVAEILCENKIVVEYQFDSQPVTCWR